MKCLHEIGYICLKYGPLRKVTCNWPKENINVQVQLENMKC